MQHTFESKNTFISLLLLVGVIIVAFFPLFTNGFVEWDDYYYITHNELITSLSLDHIWAWFTKPFHGLYQPLILMSYAINYAIDGLNPTVFHTTNLAIHIANSILVYFFILKLSKQHFIGLFTAFLFAIHPLHVESVAWATERKDTLYVLFYLIGLLYYQKYIQNGSKKTFNRVFVMLTLSLMSKGSAITFPFVLVLIDYLEERGWYKKEILMEKLPFFILAFTYGLMTFYLHYRWGAAQNHTGLETYERVLFTAYAFTQYLYKLVLPINLSAFYLYPLSDTGGFPMSYLVYWLSYVGYFGVLIYSFFRHRMLFFGLSFFLSIGLFLMTVGVPVVIADRFTYLPSIGLFLVFSYFLYQLYLRLNITKSFIQWLLVSPLLIVFTWLSFQQAKTWEEPFTLWDATYQNGYRNEYILTKRGTALIGKERYEEAEANLNEALQINPEHMKAYSYRGYLLSTLERYQESKADFLKVIKEEPKNDYAQNSLGYLEYKLEDYESAKRYLNKVLKGDSLNFDANKYMGFVLVEQDSLEKACEFMKIALDHKREETDKEEIIELEEKLARFCD